MTVVEVVKNAKDKRGITTAELSRRTGINYQALQTAFLGKRGISAPELVSLCRELELEISDFDQEVEPAAGDAV